MANELLVGVKIGAVLSGSFQSAFASARNTTLKLGQVADELRVRHSRLGDAMARAMAHPTRNVAELRRQYDRLGLVTPGRAGGGGRRYSARDVAQLREVQRLSQEEGVNLAGIKRIIDLENQVEALQSRVTELQTEVGQARDHRSDVLAAGALVDERLDIGFCEYTAA